MTQNIVITGGTSGIGQAAAIKLAEHGARIVLIARESERAASTLEKLRAVNANTNHTAYLADLSNIVDMKRVAAEVATGEGAIDVLINNAGAVFMGHELTADGLSPTFALNHLAYFVLTLKLLPNLRQATAGRIVCTSSRAHRYATVDFDRLQRDGVLGYAQSKLANLLFVRRLSQLLGDEHITVNAFHPGFVATRFADNTNVMWRTLMRTRKKLFGLTSEQGARTLICLAESPDLSRVSGGYFVECKQQAPSVSANNDEYAQKLWELSVALTGVDFSQR